MWPTWLVAADGLALAPTSQGRFADTTDGRRSSSPSSRRIGQALPSRNRRRAGPAHGLPLALVATTSLWGQTLGQPPVFKAETALIRVDALVTDRHGVPVPDLEAADFEIESDGRRYVTQVASYVDGTRPAALDLRNGTKLTAEDLRSTTTFVLALPRIVSMQGGRPGRRRPRTPDGIDRMLNAYLRDWFVPGGLAAFVNVDSDQPLLNRLQADPAAIAAVVRSVEDEWRAEKGQTIFLSPSHAGPLERYGVTVLRVAQQAVERMALRPGRKTLILIAPTLLLVDDPSQPTSGFQDLRLEVEKLARQCNQAGVTVHGLKSVPMRGLPSPAPSLGAQRTPPMFTEPTIVSSDAVAILADRTGGSTFSGADAGADDLAQVLKRNRGYYILGYDDGRERDSLPRRVKVRVKRAGAVVTARPLVFPKESAALVRTTRPVALEELLDSALSPGDFDLRIATAIEPAEEEARTLRATVTLETSSESAGRAFEFLVRVLDERANIVRTQRGKGVAGATGTVTFDMTATLRSPGYFAVDVAARGLEDERRGSASLLLRAPAETPVR